MCGAKSFVELIQAYQNWAGEALERFFIVYLHLNDRNTCGLLCRSVGAFEMKAIGVKRR
jgi:hypothetical protein